MSEQFFKEFQVGEHTYHCRRMDAKQQFHVMRRILPILTGVANSGEEGAEKVRGAAMALSEISDEDADYIIDHCLAVVKRRQGEAGFHPIWAQGAGLMFKDIDFVSMLMIVGEVLAYNLGNFSDGLPSGLQHMMEKGNSNMSPSS